MIRLIIRINSLIAAFLSVWFLIYPSARAFFDLRDPALRRPGVPALAWRLFASLTPQYARWARNRVADDHSAVGNTSDISGTEWPLFGSVFYLWGVENLQSAWDAGDHHGGLEPKIYAHDAIVAASELVIDPQQAAWVKKHWGAEYLHRENIFYRGLVMAALVSREKLLHDHAHLDLLRDQVESMARELDTSASGLLNDYPSQCFPADVMCVLLCIHRADSVLGTNHAAMIQKALRAFTGRSSTRRGLPPYMANADTGKPITDARGCANSYLCSLAPELWPAEARQWFAIYDREFWQEKLTGAGFREFGGHAANTEWSFDVDAGPVIGGYGISASAFGVCAARHNGRFDRAYPLSAELLATIGELPNGVLAMPRLLSNASAAPYLGEAAILYQLSTQPQRGFPVKTGGEIPPFAYILLGVVGLAGAFRLLFALDTFRNTWTEDLPIIRVPRLQVAFCILYLAGALVLFVFGHGIVGCILLVVLTFLPAKERPKPTTGLEDWPDQNPNPSVPTPPAKSPH